MASDAQKYVSGKIKKVLDDGTTDDPKQAAAIAYSYARKEGYDVPKKLVDRERKNKTKKKSKS